MWWPGLAAGGVVLALFLAGNLGAVPKAEAEAPAFIPMVVGLSAAFWFTLYGAALRLFEGLRERPRARGWTAVGLSTLTLFVPELGSLPGLMLYLTPGRVPLIAAALHRHDCRPLGWEGDPRPVRWARLLPDGRALVVTDREVDHYILGEHDDATAVMLSPGGEIDRAFAAANAGCQSGRPVLAADKLAFVDPTGVGSLVGLDGRMASAQELAAFWQDVAALHPQRVRRWPGEREGKLLVQLGTGSAGALAVVDLAGARARPERTYPLPGPARAFALLGPRLAVALGEKRDNDMEIRLEKYDPDDPGANARELLRLIQAKLVVLDEKGAAPLPLRLSPGVVQRFGASLAEIDGIFPWDERRVVVALQLTGEDRHRVLAFAGEETPGEPFLLDDDVAGRDPIAVVRLGDGRLAAQFADSTDEDVGYVALVEPRGRHRVHVPEISDAFPHGARSISGRAKDGSDDEVMEYLDARLHGPDWPDAEKPGGKRYGSGGAYLRRPDPSTTVVVPPARPLAVAADGALLVTDFRTPLAVVRADGGRAAFTAPAVLAPQRVLPFPTIAWLGFGRDAPDDPRD
jgi:hypothetical protein